MKDQHIGVAHAAKRIEESYIGQVGWKLYQRVGSVADIMALMYDCAYGTYHAASSLGGRI